MQAAAETLQGERGTYRVFDRVGGGGFGTVFFGRELSTNRAVALKRLHAQFVDEPQIVARFEREADLVLVRGLRHPNVVRILDRGRDAQGVPFLAMEWIDGLTVSDLLAQRGTALPIADAAAIGCAVLQGLEAAHALSIVHRDIKPANVMVTATGHVMIMDLGIAKVSDPDVTSVTGAYSAVPATLQYAAPEQLSGDREVDGRADLYSLGATLYLVLTGQRPFSGPARPEPVPVERLRPEASHELAAIVKRALANDPNKRFPTAAAMLSALRSFAPADLRVALPNGEDDDIPTGPVVPRSSDSSTSTPVSVGLPHGRRGMLPLVAGAVGVGLLAVVAIAFVLLSGQRTQNSSNATPTPLAQLGKLDAPAAWPVLKNDLADMTYVGEDVFATWASSLADGVLNYQLTAKNGASYPVPIEGHDVGQNFHYAVSAKQVSGALSSYGVIVRYPFGAKAADDSTAYYEFVVDNTSNARVALRQAGEFKTLWQSPNFGAVKPSDTNTFVVHAESASGATHFTFFLNGQYATDLIDNELERPGAVGVVMVLDGAGSAASWDFSNLELRAPQASP
jgi:serine/threonine protein kinase